MYSRLDGKETELASQQGLMKSPKMEVDPINTSEQGQGTNGRSPPSKNPPELAPPTPVYSRGSSKFPNSGGMDAIHNNPRMSSNKQIASIEKKVDELSENIVHVLHILAQQGLLGGAGAVPGEEEKKEVFDEAREEEDAKKRQSIRELRERRPKRRFPRISFAEQNIMAKLDKHVAEMNVFFEQVDKNGDGEITRQEMKVGLEALRDHPKGNHAVFAAPLLTEPEIEVVLDGLFKFHDNIDHEDVHVRFRKGANKKIKRRRANEAMCKLSICIIIISPVTCFLTAAGLALPLAWIEGWEWEDSMYLIMGEITQIGVSMGHDDFEAETVEGKLFVCIIGIWCLAFLAMLIGVMAGPLLQPVQEMMWMAPSDEEDNIGGIDIGTVIDPPRMILRTVLKVEHSQNQMLKEQHLMDQELALIKKRLGIRQKATITAEKFIYQSEK
mmetsp:Transcript_9624/g.24557  ORF Transcript_9624/g.24557 Transcript_9624/m.24557 type:complete len:441 (+) Transcript_9624:87-1409(+)